MNVSGGGRYFIIFGTQWLKLWNGFVESPYIIYGCLSYNLMMLSAKYDISMSISDVTLTQYLNIPNVSPEKGVLAP